MPSKLPGVGTADVTTTVVDAVLVEVVKKTVVVVTLFIVVYVEVVEKVLILIDAVLVTVIFLIVVVLIVFVADVMVVSGVEADSTTITSGSRVLVDDEVGIGVLAGELVSLIRHCTVCIVVELIVAVKVSPAMIKLGRANQRNNSTNLMRDLIVSAHLPPQLDVPDQQIAFIAQVQVTKNLIDPPKIKELGQSKGERALCTS